MLNLSFIRTVLSEFDLRKAFLELDDLSIKSLNVLLLHADFMLDLGMHVLLVLLHFDDSGLQIFDNKFFFSSLFPDA